MGPDIVGILAVFGMPVAIVFISKYFKALEKGLIGPRARGQLDEAAQKKIEALLKERALLEGRVQNLESIVCSVDMELNARLNRLAAAHSQALRLPAAAAAATMTAAPSPLPAGGFEATVASTPAQASGSPVAVGQTLAGR
jgi:hypothetical protein